MPEDVKISLESTINDIASLIKLQKNGILSYEKLEIIQSLKNKLIMQNWYFVSKLTKAYQNNFNYETILEVAYNSLVSYINACINDWPQVYFSYSGLQNYIMASIDNLLTLEYDIPKQII